VSSLRVCPLIFCLAAIATPQTPQESAIAKQREAIERQRQAMMGQDGSITRQKASVARQAASAASQPASAFGATPPAFAVSQVQMPASGPECEPMDSARLEPLIAKASTDHALTPDLLRAIIRRESAGRPCAVSRAGAMGLMQLMPGTASDLRVSNPFDPEQNISAGSRFLRLMLDRYGGDLSLALGAYNAGPGKVDAAGGVPAIQETRDYVADILGRMR
jgi:soluble lytic murein transglycosylase-like protein